VRFRIDWTTDVGQLAAIEASLADVATHAAALAAGYNHPANAELIEDGGRAFLLHRDGELAGDGDLRHLRDGGAEFAFMIGAPAAQGRGLGTRFAIMIHAFGFREAGLHHIYASIVPHNTASRRVFDKLGYVVDDGAIARGFADEPGDVVMAIDRATFERAHAAALGQIHIAAIPRRH